MQPSTCDGSTISAKASKRSLQLLIIGNYSQMIFDAMPARCPSCLRVQLRGQNNPTPLQRRLSPAMIAATSCAVPIVLQGMAAATVVSGQVFHSEAYPIASPVAAKSCPCGSMLAIANARMGQLAVATMGEHRCLLTLLSNLNVQPLQPVISTCTPLEFIDSAVAPSTIVEASEAPSCSTRGLKTCCPRNF